LLCEDGLAQIILPDNICSWSQKDKARERKMDSNAQPMDRRAFLHRAGIIGLGGAIGAGVTPCARGITLPILPHDASTIRPYPFPVDILYHGSRTRSQIALTFDACPRKERPEFSTEIVDYLQREHIPATFFVSGLWAENCQDGLKRLAETPFFQIGLHGYHHRKSSELTEPAIASEIEQTRSTIVRMGYKPQPFFRPPYGDCPPKLVKVAKSLGVLTVMWDVVSGDPNPRNTAEILQHRVSTLTRNGSIIIMHVNNGGKWTAQALPTIVASLTRRGFQFVSVGDLLKHATGKRILRERFLREMSRQK
jgi:peptidoglycan-N-acetylglucosamine deacetylase